MSVQDTPLEHYDKLPPPFFFPPIWHFLYVPCIWLFNISLWYLAQLVYSLTFVQFFNAVCKPPREWIRSSICLAPLP